MPYYNERRKNPTPYPVPERRFADKIKGKYSEPGLHFIESIEASAVYEGEVPPYKSEGKTIKERLRAINAISSENRRKNSFRWIEISVLLGLLSDPQTRVEVMKEFHDRRREQDFGVANWINNLVLEASMIAAIIAINPHVRINIADVAARRSGGISFFALTKMWQSENSDMDTQYSPIFIHCVRDAKTKYSALVGTNQNADSLDINLLLPGKPHFDQLTPDSIAGSKRLTEYYEYIRTHMQNRIFTSPMVVFVPERYIVCNRSAIGIKYATKRRVPES